MFSKSFGDNGRIVVPSSPTTISTRRSPEEVAIRRERVRIAAQTSIPGTHSERYYTSRAGAIVSPSIAPRQRQPGTIRTGRGVTEETLIYVPPPDYYESVTPPLLPEEIRSGGNYPAETMPEGVAQAGFSELFSSLPIWAWAAMAAGAFLLFGRGKKAAKRRRRR